MEVGIGDSQMTALTYRPVGDQHSRAQAYRSDKSGQTGCHWSKAAELLRQLSREPEVGMERHLTLCFVGTGSHA